MDKKTVDNAARIILAEASIKAGNYVAGINLLKKSKLTKEENINISEKLILLLKKEERLTIFADELDVALSMWIKAGKEISLFIEKIVSHFPGTAYKILLKTKRDNSLNYEVLLSNIISSLNKIIVYARKHLNDFQIKEIEKLCSKNEELGKLLIKIADAYFRMGLIKEGLNIYTPKRTIIEQVARTYSNDPNVASKCYIYLEDVDALKEILPRLIKINNGKRAWKVSRKIAELELKNNSVQKNK